MTPDQNKAFSKIRKGGQVLEATQGIEDFLKEQGHTVHKETVIDVGQSSRDSFVFIEPREDNETLDKVLEAAKASGRSDEMLVLSFANDECKRAYEIGRKFAQDGNSFKKDGVPAELIELLRTAKTDRGEIERSYTDGKLSVIEEAQE